uniref:Putative DNA binding, helix-turn-helix domain containing protein n=1 Tax=viral metagenome TaxID=1070528 RepID=A0A6H1ZH52_9ZZZZ
MDAQIEPLRRMDPDRLLPTRQVAVLLGRSPRTIRKMVSMRVILAVPAGPCQNLFFRVADVIEYIDRQRLFVKNRAEGAT